MTARSRSLPARTLSALALSICALASAAYGNELSLQPDTPYREVAAHVAFAEDASHRLTLAEARARPELFAPLHGGAIDFGFTDERIWLRLPVRNADRAARRSILAFNTSFMHRIDAWLVTDDGARLLIHQTEDSVFSTRPTDEPELSAPFELAPEEAATIYIAYWSKGGTALPIAIETRTTFAEARAAETAWNTAFYALMAALIVFSSLSAAALRSRLYLLYALYVASALLFILHGDGLTFRYLWPHWPQWNAFASLPLGFGMTMAAGFFTRAFLDTRTAYPAFDKAFIAVIAVSAAGILAGLAFERAAKAAGFPLVFASSLVFLAGGVRALQDRVPGALFYVIGWTSISGAALVAFAINSPLVPGVSQATFDLVRVSMAFDALMMGLALLVRLKLIRDERNRLRDRELVTLRANLDLTDRLNALEHRLALATASAAAAGRTLTGALHDLRQPLLSLRMTAQRLARDPAAAHEAASLEASLAYMENLAETTLAASVGGGAPAHVDGAAGPETFSAQLLLDALERMFAADARAKGLRFACAPSRRRITAQPTALLRILSNFAANAVKYTRSGKILIGCRRRGGRVWICVVDTGPGLAADEIERMMRPGERGPAAASGEDGLGIGLAVAARLASEHDYALEVRSRPGRGSCFAVGVPAAGADASDRRPCGAAVAHGGE